LPAKLESMATDSETQVLCAACGGTVALGGAAQSSSGESSGVIVEHRDAKQCIKALRRRIDQLSAQLGEALLRIPKK
jgi:hypothetical protein